MFCIFKYMELGKNLPRLLWSILFYTIIIFLVFCFNLIWEMFIACISKYNWFCLKALYLPTFLNSIMHSNIFLVNFLGFSRYTIIFSVNNGSFIFYFWYVKLFFPPWLIVFGRLSRIMLDRSSKSRHFYLFPNL